MKTVNWLVEKSVLDDDKMLKEIERQEFNCKLVENLTFFNSEEIKGLFSEDECVVFYGTLGSSQNIRRYAPWIPGCFCDLKKYECVYYYPEFGSFLLNENYLMFPFGDLERRKNFLFDFFNDDKFFMKPNSGFKIFGGDVVKRGTWKYDANKKVDKEKLVVVSSVKPIEKEWRLVVVENKVIAGSQYIENDEIVFDVCPEEVFEYGNYVLSEVKYSPEKAWCLDICLSEGNYRVLEVNAFSTSGLYICDLEPVVREVSRVSLEEWKEFNSF